MKNCRKILSVFFILLAAVISTMAQGYYTKKLYSESSRKNDEVAPVMLGKKMVYCSNRPIPGPISYTNAALKLFFKIVESEVDSTKDGKGKPQKLFAESLKTNFHDGPVSFNESGDYMVLTRCFDEKTNKQTPSNFGLYFADKENEVWGNIQEFPFNDREANTIQPSFNSDASTLYFSSNRAGGFGGYDLYVSRFKNGAWQTPENLGPRINTAENEIYPFLHSTGRLYFSSEGHDNKAGGYDLFYSEFYNGQWINPIKLPSPFNSSSNDYTFYIDKDFQKGLYTSSSRGSKDIYTFKSTIPNFEVTQEQRLNNYCFVFFEENTMELDTNMYLFEWSLGDKSKVRAMEAKHCYAVSGNYTVSLNIIDKLTKEVLFNQAEYELNIERIVQAFITCPDTIAVNEDIQFSGTESYFKDVNPGEYYWDFGDGSKAIGASARHTYRVPGKYIVKLGVIEDNPNVKVVPREFCSYKTIVVTEN